MFPAIAKGSSWENVAKNVTLRIHATFGDPTEHMPELHRYILSIVRTMREELIERYVT